jgi:hypothetical protein
VRGRGEREKRTLQGTFTLRRDGNAPQKVLASDEAFWGPFISERASEGTKMKVDICNTSAVSKSKNEMKRTLL